MKKSGLLAAVVSLSAVLVIFFQNCAEDLPGIVKGSETQNSSSGSGPSKPPAFNKFESFDYSKVTNRSQMVEQMLAFKGGYASWAGPKAVSIAADGLGFVSRLPTSATQDEANTMALAGCYMITSGRPCALLASGSTFNLGGNDLAKSYTYSMPGPAGTLTPDALFFLPAASRMTFFNSYSGAKTPKAIAFSLDGTVVTVNNAAQQAAVGSSTYQTTINNPFPDVADARKVALERCEMMATISPCIAFADDLNIVLTPANVNRSPLINYAQTTVMAGVLPGQAKNIIAREIDLRYFNGNDSTKAISMSNTGKYGVDMSGNLATSESTAKSRCESNHPNLADFPCAPYASMDTVLFNATKITAYKAGLPLHCKAVPRYDCAAHKLMGCPGGDQYYVTRTGSVKLEFCN